MLTVRYALTREELWAWYKVSWLKRLWVYHLAIVAMSCVTFALFQVGGSSVSGVIVGACVGLGLMLFMVAWPQVRYRPQERTLTFDAEGLSYVRGPQTGRMPWKQIRSVADAPEGVVITGHSLSAFIVPNRAFGGDAEKAEAFSAISDLYRRAL
ncbi:MAG: YcxB family protein [Brevundimonas sp.]|nr:MAG: YcxB family protein [Brevundimonas sp.]